jgi:uncharacterized protein YicC (UPF0701 family)
MTESTYHNPYASTTTTTNSAAYAEAMKQIKAMQSGPYYMTNEQYLQVVHEAHTAFITERFIKSGTFPKSHIVDISTSSADFFEIAYLLFDSLSTVQRNITQERNNEVGHATQTYYETKIAKLEAKLERVKDKLQKAKESKKKSGIFSVIKELEQELDEE